MARTDLRFDVTALDQASRAFQRMGQAVDRFERRLDALDGKKVRAEVDVDSSRADRELGAFARDLQRKVSAAVKALPDIELDADASDAQREIARIRGELAALGDKRIGVDIDAAAAQTELARLNGELKALAAESVDVQVQADTAAALAALRVVDAEIDKLDGRTARVRVDVDRGFGEAVVRVAALGRALGQLALPASLIAAAPQLASLGGAAVSASGALALIPAAGFAAAAGVGALVVGLQGFGDALAERGDPAKFAEALQKLSPAAQAAAVTIRDLGGAWREMQQGVQEDLFVGVAEQLQRLSTSYLPILKSALSGIATEINRAGAAFTEFATSARTTIDAAAGLGNIRIAASQLAPILTNVSAIFRDVGVVGSRSLPGLASGFADATGRAAAFVAEARRTGELAEFIQRGIDTVAQLGRILGNVGSIAGSVFDAAEQSGADFLGTVERITGGIEAFFDSAQGNQALVDFFTEIRTVIDNLMPGLEALGTAVVNVIQQLSNAGVLSGAAAALSAIAVEAAPVVEALGTLASVILPPLLSALQGLAPVLVPVAVGLAAMWAAAKGATILTAATAGLTGFVGKVREVEGAGGRLRTGLGGVAGFLGAGGPWGLAIGVGVTALAALIGSQQNAAAAAAEHQAAVDGLVGTLDQYSGAATEATITQTVQDLASRKLSDGTTTFAQALQGAGISLRDYSEAASGVPGKLEQVNGQLVEATTWLPAMNDMWDRHRGQMELAGVSYEVFAAAALGNVEAMDKVSTAFGDGEQGAALMRVAFDNALGPLAELGSNLGVMSGQASEAAQQVRDAQSATQNFTQTLDAIKVGFAGLAAGAPVTELMAAGFRDLSLAAGVAADSAGDAAAQYGGVAAGAAEAEQSMVGSRQAFIDSATAAGMTAEQAGRVATEIGLIPAAARTIFETNATGVAAEMITLGAQVAAVPGAKQITVSTLSEPAIEQLRAVGFEVTTLPNGQVQIDVQDEAGRARLDAFMGFANSQVGTILLEADPAPANGKINATVRLADGSTGEITVDANQAPANGKINAVVRFADGSTGTVDIDANQAPADGKINAVVRRADGSTGTVVINANDLATPVLNRLDGRQTSSTHTIRYTRIGNPGGRASEFAHGGIVAPMAGGGLIAQTVQRPAAAFANGGAAGQGQRLTPMAPYATVVAPDTWRVVGDNLRHREVYAPLDGSARSLGYLRYGAREFGYDLVPRGDRGLVAMAGGGILQRERVTLGGPGGLVPAPVRRDGSLPNTPILRPINTRRPPWLRPADRLPWPRPLESPPWLRPIGTGAGFDLSAVVAGLARVRAAVADQAQLAARIDALADAIRARAPINVYGPSEPVEAARSVATVLSLRGI